MVKRKILLLIATAVFSSIDGFGQHEMESHQKLIQHKLEECERCLEEAKTNSQMIRCFKEVTFAYDSLAAIYQQKLNGYLTKDHKAILGQLYEKNDSLQFWVQKLNEELFHGKTYDLGDEARIAAATIMKDVAANKYHLLYSYVVSICERSEEPCPLWAN